MPKEKPEKLRRSDDLMGRVGSKARDRLRELFKDVRQGFEGQSDRADDILDWWDCYNCILGAQQYYNGQAQLYIPIVRDAVNARATRFVNQLFPPSGRWVESTPSDGKQPMAILALVEHYIREAKLKTKVAKPLCIAGDIEGQYNLYVDWNEFRRWSVSRETRGVTLKVLDAEVEVPPGEDGEDGIEDIVEEEISLGRPVLEVLHDSDVLVLPQTADSIEEALQKGGSVTIVRRWSKAQVKKMIAEGEIRKTEGERLVAVMNDAGKPDNSTIRKNPAKELAEAAGIRDRGKSVLAYETWSMIPLNDEGRFDEDGDDRLCRAYFGGDTEALGLKRNPFWNDRCPLLSEPVMKVAGVFKGQSLVEPGVATLQWHANDVANQGADSATYALLPIVATDPAANPRTNTMILSPAAIWEVSPNSTRFMEFPKLWQDAIALIQADMRQIFQSLGINPAMLPQQTGRPGAKRNQAEISLEQSVDLLTTAEAVSVLEEGIFSPLCLRFVELDHQFRDDAVTIRVYGDMGRMAQMEEIPLIQAPAKYEFRWLGVEAARTAQMMQQQIAWLNVARGVAPLLAAEGYQLRFGPSLEASAASVFGPRIAPLTLIDLRAQLTVDPEVENQMLAQGHDVPVHPMDDDPRHMAAHAKAEQETGDPHGTIRVHNAKHNVQQGLKASAQAMAQGGQPQGLPPADAGNGVPGGMTRPGAQPAAGRPAQGPPGMIHQDRMPLAFPRKT